ncbi:MAG: hypothetical protein AAFQ67_01060, partial [Pseudomonadota bacterium]
GTLGYLHGRLHQPRTYKTLYVVGAAIAIYAHVIGLVAMGAIGLVGLISAALSNDRNEELKSWFITNVILFVVVLPWLIQIPGASGTFPGLGGKTLVEIQWLFRNAVGFPAIGGLSFLFDVAFYGVAGLAVLVAWFQNKRPLALTIGGFIVLYPLLIGLLHLRTEIITIRVFLPVLIGLALGVGYLASRLKTPVLRAAALAPFFLAGLASATTELRYHIKVENYPAAFDRVAAAGFQDPVILGCLHFSTGAIWEADNTADIYYLRRGQYIHYKGPEFWRAAAMTMAKLRVASPEEIDAELGGGWLVEGGLASIVEGRSEVAFMRRQCGDEDGEDVIHESLTSLGFTRLSDDRVNEGEAPDTIFHSAQSRLSLYRRP